MRRTVSKLVGLDPLRDAKASTNSPLADHGAFDVKVKHLAQLVVGLTETKVFELFLERRRFQRVALCVGGDLCGRRKVVGQGGDCKLARGCFGDVGQDSDSALALLAFCQRSKEYSVVLTFQSGDGRTHLWIHLRRESHHLAKQL